mmetsp:Transcript_4114/g.10035  ORF Transcript_4114/g.10035 Transcript_4114/m.10035 type:complete len:291 (-) Transcript_4114:2725-3597(-)
MASRIIVVCRFTDRAPKRPVQNVFVLIIIARQRLETGLPRGVCTAIFSHDSATFLSCLSQPCKIAIACPAGGGEVRRYTIAKKFIRVWRYDLEMRARARRSLRGRRSPASGSGAHCCVPAVHVDLDFGIGCFARIFTGSAVLQTCAELVFRPGGFRQVEFPRARLLPEFREVFVGDRNPLRAGEGLVAVVSVLVAVDVVRYERTGSARWHDRLVVAGRRARAVLLLRRVRRVKFQHRCGIGLVVVADAHLKNGVLRVFVRVVAAAPARRVGVPLQFLVLGHIHLFRMVVT